MPALKSCVSIAGGGLAGLSLAAGLRGRGVPVQVHEAGCYPRHRVCGEFISGVSGETLQQLGIADLLADARRLETLVWQRQGRTLLEDRLPEAAYGISRHRLDARLAARVRERGGVVVEASRIGIVRDPEAAGRGGVPATTEGQVWTTGRLPVKSRWIGLKMHFHGLPLLADLEMHLGDNGYVGLAGIEDGKVNLCGLFRLDRGLKGQGLPLLSAYLAAGGQTQLLARLQQAAETAEEASFRAVAGFRTGRQPQRSGVLALGDAASMIPPFTGHGMSMAFEAAALALEPLAAWSSGERSWLEISREIRGTLLRVSRKRLAAAAFLHSLLLHAAGRELLQGLARTGLLPFRPLLSLVRP